jgi:hypothetical protein
MNMKRFVLLSISIFIILFTSCEISSSFVKREWTGTSLITVTSSGVPYPYSGTVRLFSLDSDNLCILEIDDLFLTGSTTRKEYSGVYSYDDKTHFLDFVLTLSRIDGEPVSTNMDYKLDVEDTFDIDSKSGNLDGTMYGGDMPDYDPPDFAVTISLSLTT